MNVLLVLLVACGPNCEPVQQRALDLTALDAASGLEWCWRGDQNNGYLRRVADVVQVVDLHDSETCSEPETGTCVSNAECGEDVCTGDRYGFTACNCARVCQSDADCAEGTLCAPGTVGSAHAGASCVAASCTTGADCASGICRIGKDDCGFPERAACTTSADTCTYDSQCGGLEYCGFDVVADAFGCLPSATCE